MHYFSESYITTMDPKVSPVGEKTEFLSNEETDLKCIFEKTWSEKVAIILNCP